MQNKVPGYAQQKTQVNANKERARRRCPPSHLCLGYEQWSGYALSLCLAGVPCRCSRCCACQSDLSSFQDAAFPVFVLFF